LLAIENIEPQQRYMEPIMLASPDRDERILQVAESIRSIGRAGIPYFGYYWLVSPLRQGGHGVIRTSSATAGRGGALVDAWDIEAVRDLPLYRDRVYSMEELSENHAYFLRAILPVASEAGVTISLHPDDPPTPEALGGIGRVFWNYRAFKDAADVAGSHAPWGLTFCLGNWSLMPEGDLERGLRDFGRRGQISYLHVQSVQGTPSRFREVFLDEAQTHLGEVITTLRELDFTGTLVVAHLPMLEGDPFLWADRPRALAYSVGYVKGLLQMTDVGDGKARRTRSSN
jgi:mannonate dehydratase